MAILIQSKNTYETNNPKIRGNIIDNVSVEQTVILPNNQYDVPVHNAVVETFDSYKVSQETENSNGDRKNRIVSGGGGTANDSVYAFVAYLNQKTYSAQIKIPVSNKNNWIKSIKTGEYDNKETGQKEKSIKVSLYGTIEKGSANATVVDKTGEIKNLTFSSAETSDTLNFAFPQSIETSYSAFNLTAVAKENINDISNISTATYSIQTIGNIEYYVFNLSIFCDCRVVKLRGSNHSLSTELPDGQLFGEYENYVSVQAEVTFYGNTIGIDLTDGSITYGEGNKPFLLNRNELLQDSGMVENKTISQHLGETILSQYKNGKETATILCDIGEYYNQQGEKAISTIDSSLPMTFKIGDEVIPYVYGADEQDHPMSLYKDGSAKVFRVLGTEIYYDGAVWQKLTLQEI